MKEYDVTITETLEKTVTIKASSIYEADLKISEMYRNEEIVLDETNYTGVEYNIREVKDKK